MVGVGEGVLRAFSACEKICFIDVHHRCAVILLTDYLGCNVLPGWVRTSVFWCYQQSRGYEAIPWSHNQSEKMKVWPLMTELRLNWVIVQCQWKFSPQSSTGQLPFFIGRGHCAATMFFVTSTLLLQFQLKYTMHDRNPGTLSQFELIVNEFLLKHRLWFLRPKR